MHDENYSDEKLINEKIPEIKKLLLNIGISRKEYTIYTREAVNILFILERMIMRMPKNE